MTISLILLYYICIFTREANINKKKLLTIIILPLLCTFLAHPQSLVELAKKEKERREKLKDKKVSLVTNADLKKFNKKTKVNAKQTNNSKNVQSNSPPVPRQIPVIPSPKLRKKNRNIIEETNEAKKKYQEVNKLIGQLNLKMRSLWRQLNSLNNARSKSRVQQQISQTYLRLQKAQKDAAELKKQIDMRQKIPQ